MNNTIKANVLFDQGYAYETGKNIEKNIDKAIEKYLEAGNLGHEEALCKAGHCYQFLKGDIEKAIELYRKSIEKGSANGKFLLGNCYYEGIGVNKDTIKGSQLRNEALMEGSALAQIWVKKIEKRF